MLPPGEVPLNQGVSLVSAPASAMDASQAALLSPSIQRSAGDVQVAAYELKYLIHESIAVQVESWALDSMHRDAFADLSHGGYQTTTLYLDTPARDVFHRSKGFRKFKHRLRRYGTEDRLYLERKMRQGNRVSKKRCDVPMRELCGLASGIDAQQLGESWPGQWYRQAVADKSLMPSCLLTYDRNAFVRPGEQGSDGPLRLTLDRRIRGIAADRWDLTPLDEGHAILPEHVICEFKFRGAMPNLFKQIIGKLEIQAGSVSKYRRMMLAAGAVPVAVATTLGHLHA